jgi:hypothetical protein
MTTRKPNTTTTTKVKKEKNKAPAVPVVHRSKISNTEANKARRMERDRKAKEEARRRKMEKDVQDEKLLDALVARGHSMVRLPDRKARQAVREWQERKTLRNLLALGYGA